MTFQRSRSSLLGQKPEIVSDLITTSEKVEKKKKKNAGKKPKGKYLLLCACLHFKVARREFPRGNVSVYMRKSKSRNLLLLGEQCLDI